MKRYYQLAWKEIKAQKVTSVLILIAVILSTLMTTVVGQSIGILNTMRIQQAADLNGRRHMTFHQLTQAQKSLLYEDSRMEYVGSFLTLGNAALGNSGMKLFLREYQDGDLEQVYPGQAVLKEGRLPMTSSEIALPQDALDFLGFNGQAGDSISLDLSISLMKDTQIPYEYHAEFILSGILESNYLAYSSGTLNGVAGPGAAQSLLPERYLLFSTDFSLRSLDHFQDTADSLINSLQIGDDYVQYNWIYLNALGVHYAEAAEESSGFSFLTVSCILVGLLVLAAAGLVFYNILKIAVSKRTTEYGTLRALGASQGKLYGLVSLQLFILCGMGIPVGVMAATAVSRSILSAAMNFLSPGAFQASNLEELQARLSSTGSGGLLPILLSVLITLLFAFGAAMPAARYAARVSPTVAMRGSVLKVRRHSRKERHIRSFEAFYARLNLKRNPARTAITILSLVMSITVFVALQSFSTLLDASQDVKALHLGDYSITNEVPGFTPKELEQVRSLPEVESLAFSRLSVYTQDEEGNIPLSLDFRLNPAETFQIAAVNEERFLSYAPQLTQSQLEDILEGTACLVKNPIAISYGGTTFEHTQFAAGDTITIDGRRLKVAAVTDGVVTLNNNGFANGIQIIVSDKTYSELTGSNQYQELYPVLHEDANTESFEARLEELRGTIPGTIWISYQNTDKQLEESFAQIHLLCWGLILFIGLIGILNIINTVTTNIHTRMNEIGMQRAIGMSASSLYLTFLWEAAYYGLIASVLGAAAGTLCTAFIQAAVSGTFTAPAIPVLPILEAVSLSILACLAATALPLKQIARMNIVDSIETVE